MLPVQRTYQFQGAAPALNVPVFMADLQTLQNNFLTLTPQSTPRRSDESTFSSYTTISIY